LAFHLAAGWLLAGPILYEDPMGYLAIARDLAWPGAETHVNARSGAYHVGYGYLLAPLYWLLGTSWRVYRAAVVLDSLLATLHLAILYRLGRRALLLPRRAAITASVIAAVYPAQLLQSTFVWTETLFALVFSAWVLACSWLND